MTLNEAEQNRLIMGHTDLVSRIAPNFRGRKGIPYDELCSEGTLALVASARRWAGRGDFSEYAAKCIKGRLKDFISGWQATAPLDREDEVETRVFEPHAAWKDVPATPEQIRTLFEETADRTAAVEAALIGLSPKERRMVEAHFLDKPKIGLAQIARDNKVSYFAAVNTVYRAVKKMRETIERIEKNQSGVPRKGRPTARAGEIPANVIPFITRKRAAHKQAAS